MPPFPPCVFEPMLDVDLRVPRAKESEARGAANDPTQPRAARWAALLHSLRVSSPPARHVLVLDDEVAMLRTVSRFLTPWSEIHTARSIEEAWSILRTNPIDVVLADWHIGRVENGLAFLAEIQRTRPRIRRCLMSASGDWRDDIARDDETVQEFVEKPFGYRTLVTQVLFESSLPG